MRAGVQKVPGRSSGARKHPMFRRWQRKSPPPRRTRYHSTMPVPPETEAKAASAQPVERFVGGLAGSPSKLLKSSWLRALPYRIPLAGRNHLPRPAAQRRHSERREAERRISCNFLFSPPSMSLKGTGFQPVHCRQKELSASARPPRSATRRGSEPVLLCLNI